MTGPRPTFVIAFVNILILTTVIGGYAMAAAPAVAIKIAQDGRSDYVIVTADDAPAPVLHAAKELQEHLKLSTGAELPIRKLSESPAEQRQILVGPSQRAQAIAAEIDKIHWPSLEQDGIVILTAGDTLILAGGEPRGTLYAVNTFLEEVVGVRWWTSSERDVPKKSTLIVDGKLDLVYTPPLRYREAFYHDYMKNAAHATRLRINGHHHEIPPEFGGHYEILGWCHTFYQLLPPEDYFEQHPEWYSEIEGKRTTHHAQLCLTNDQMRQELVRRAMEWIREKPSAGIISISQNDSGGACQCSNCQAIVAEEGSESGPLVRFVNAVAADIAQKYPNFLVETLAYQYTRKPPARTRPADNVLIRLCSIEANFAQPLGSEENKAFADDLRGWSQIAPKLFAWNYVTNFGNYLIPQANMPSLGEDLRLFVDHNVVGVFEQGDVFNEGGGDFLHLRGWMISHLLWDPSADQQALRADFLNGYYGAAGKPLGRYLDLIADAAQSSGVRHGFGHSEVNYASPKQWELANGLFDQAEKAVAGDPEKLARVKRERVVLEHVNLLRYDFEGRARALARKSRLSDREAMAAACAEYEVAVDAFATNAKEQGVRSYREGGRFEDYVPTLRARCAEHMRQYTGG